MKDIDQLFDDAKYGNLPKDFKDQTIKTKFGISVAHVAAKYGNLPEDFKDWKLKDDEGWTVAH